MLFRNIFLILLVMSPKAFCLPCEESFANKSEPYPWLKNYESLQDIMLEFRQFLAKIEHAPPVRAENSNHEMQIVGIYLRLYEGLYEGLSSSKDRSLLRQGILLWLVFVMREQPEIISATISAVLKDNPGKENVLISITRLLPIELLAYFPFSQLPVKSANEILNNMSSVDLLSVVGLERNSFLFSEIKQMVESAFIKVAQELKEKEGEEIFSKISQSSKPYNTQEQSLKRVTPLDVLMKRLQGAPPKELKGIYREVVMKWHPDRNSSPSAHQRFIQIKDAYDKLYEELYSSSKDS